MSWLHQLTGFQLFVISSFYEVSFSFAEARYERTKRLSSASSMALSFIIGAFFTIYWLIVAVF